MQSQSHSSLPACTVSEGAGEHNTASWLSNSSWINSSSSCEMRLRGNNNNNKVNNHKSKLTSKDLTKEFNEITFYDINTIKFAWWV